MFFLLHAFDARPQASLFFSTRRERFDWDPKRVDIDARAFLIETFPTWIRMRYDVQLRNVRLRLRIRFRRLGNVSFPKKETRLRYERTDSRSDCVGVDGPNARPWRSDLSLRSANSTDRNVVQGGNGSRSSARRSRAHALARHPIVPRARLEPHSFEERSCSMLLATERTSFLVSKDVRRELRSFMHVLRRTSSARS